MKSVSKPNDSDNSDAIFDTHEIKNKLVGAVISIDEGTTRREITAGYVIRRAVVDFGVESVNRREVTIKFTECLRTRNGKRSYPTPRHVGEFYYKIPTVGLDIKVKR
jgi:hypothetical protein